MRTIELTMEETMYLKEIMCREKNKELLRLRTLQELPQTEAIKDEIKHIQWNLTQINYIKDSIN